MKSNTYTVKFFTHLINQDLPRDMPKEVIVENKERKAKPTAQTKDLFTLFISAL